MADEEPVCPKPQIEESCRPRCVKALLELQVCRVIEEIPKVVLFACDFLPNLDPIDLLTTNLH